MFYGLDLLELRRFLIFAIIGVFNTAFDFVLWHRLVKFVKPDSTFEKFILKLKLNKYSFAQGLAFIIANIVSYFLNRSFTFSDSKVGSAAKSMGAFFLVSLFSLSISVLCMNFLTKNEKVLAWSKTLPQPLAKRWTIIAKLIITPVTLTTNFVGYKLFAF
jgi:putative flippase GtrA